MSNTANLTSVQYNFDTIHVDDDLFNEDQAMNELAKLHKNPHNDEERKELGDLSKNRASALSDALGVKVSSVANTKYVRLPELLINLEMARTDGSYKKS